MIILKLTQIHSLQIPPFHKCFFGFVDVTRIEGVKWPVSAVSLDLANMYIVQSDMKDLILYSLLLLKITYNLTSKEKKRQNNHTVSGISGDQNWPISFIGKGHIKKYILILMFFWASETSSHCVKVCFSVSSRAVMRGFYSYRESGSVFFHFHI